MSSVDWKAKLSSRKFWVGVALVVIGVVMCVAGDTQNGVAVITLGAVSYLGAEVLVDIARAIFPIQDENAEMEDE